MPRRGFEPLHLQEALAPQASASTNSATPALIDTKYYSKIMRCQGENEKALYQRLLPAI